WSSDVCSSDLPGGSTNRSSTLTSAPSDIGHCAALPLTRRSIRTSNSPKLPTSMPDEPMMNSQTPVGSRFAYRNSTLPTTKVRFPKIPIPRWIHGNSSRKLLTRERCTEHHHNEATSSRSEEHTS